METLYLDSIWPSNTFQDLPTTYRPSLFFLIIPWVCLVLSSCGWVEGYPWSSVTWERPKENWLSLLWQPSTTRASELEVGPCESPLPKLVFWLAWPCAVVPANTVPMSSWVYWPCHGQKMAFYSRPPQPLALGFFLHPLLQCVLNGWEPYSFTILHDVNYFLLFMVRS